MVEKEEQFEQDERIREIIREEFQSFISLDKYIFQKNLQIFDGRNIQTGRTTGTKIGTEGGTNGQKLGFFNTTPVDQPETVADASGGATVDTGARTAVNAIRDRLQELGLIK